MHLRPQSCRVRMRRRPWRIGVFAFAAGCLACGLFADDDPGPADLSWYKRWTRNVSNTWDSRQWDIFVPLRIWHDREAYDDMSQMNEEPWGLGAGKFYHDEKSNRHSLVVMGFQDSHNEFEPVAGYMWQKLWRNDADTWRLSLGYMAGVTMRGDFHYIPFPIALPVAGVEYRRLSLEFTYIPPLTGVDFTGSALFVWARWRM